MDSIFTGSYSADDVHVLLKPINIPDTPIAEKEKRIQLDNRHYSEMLSYESLPSDEYMILFHQAMIQNQQQMARDCLRLAEKITTSRLDDIVLVSLARAGTPVGVILKHALTTHYQRKVWHYSISIIRDRGIDENALAYILDRHADSSLVFVDGWTGKGVIARELHKSIAAYNAQQQLNIDSGLYVLVDLAGVAAVSASSEDYLIPSAILNATLSGLISRSVLNADYMGEDDFHGCVYYKNFQGKDLSQWFVKEIGKHIEQLWKEGVPADADTPQVSLLELQRQSKQFLEQVKNDYGIDDEKRVKPGIGEATRVLLRRIPDVLLLRDANDLATRHLQVLADEKQVPITYRPDLPYRAVSLIKKVI
ncbi:MAG: cysteine protease StiP family protein [Methylococcales bacterium]|nr:cysteine protease StiP family protein [Methylococcales bacterium]